MNGQTASKQATTRADIDTLMQANIDAPLAEDNWTPTYWGNFLDDGRERSDAVVRPRLSEMFDDGSRLDLAVSHVVGEMLKFCLNQLVSRVGKVDQELTDGENCWLMQLELMADIEQAALERWPSEHPERYSDRLERLHRHFPLHPLPERLALALDRILASDARLNSGDEVSEHEKLSEAIRNRVCNIARDWIYRLAFDSGGPDSAVHYTLNEAEVQLVSQYPSLLQHFNEQALAENRARVLAGRNGVRNRRHPDFGPTPQDCACAECLEAEA